MFRASFFLLLAFCFLLLFAGGCTNPFVETQAQREERQKLVTQAENSRLIILDVYHNHCESCKKIEPIIEKLKSEYIQNENLVFLKYDLSNPVTIFKSKKVAKTLGLEQIYNTQKYSGVVLFIDSKSKEVLDTLVGEYNVSNYDEIIDKRLHET